MSLYLFFFHELFLSVTIKPSYCMTSVLSYLSFFLSVSSAHSLSLNLSLSGLPPSLSTWGWWVSRDRARRCLSQYVFYTFHILSHLQQQQQQQHPLEGLGLKNVEFAALLLCLAPRRLKNWKKCQMAANFEIKHGVPFLSLLSVAWVGLGLF